jgi:pimeloyl-ACP methyl ester carboxylesterase
LENDEVVPVSACDKISRERVPQAAFTILPGVGHDPMIDDPDLVARTILAVTGAGRVLRHLLLRAPNTVRTF